MQKVFEILASIRATSSRNEKLAILKANADNEDLRSYLRMAYEPRVNFFMKKVEPEFAAGSLVMSTGQKFTDDTMAEVYDTIAKRELTGHAAKAWVAALHASLDTAGKELLELLIQKDVKAGISATTINGVWPGLVTQVPYMRCLLPKNVDLKAWPWKTGIFSQIKADGQYANVSHHARTRVVTIESRNGSPMPLDYFQDLIEEVQRLIPEGWQLHGELLMTDPEGNLLPREQGNGMFNSLLQGGELEAGYTPVYQAWDMIPLTAAVPKGKYEVPYKERFNKLLTIFADVPTYFVMPIEYEIVHSLEQAYEHAKLVMQRGLEGTVIKHPDGFWEDSDGSKHQIKLKLEFEVDLLVVGLNAADAKSKNVDTFGSLECWTSDGKLRVGVTGIKDDKRKAIFNNRENIVGKRVITVRANGIMQPNEDTEGYFSLFLPRFVEERLDKTTADSLDKVQEIQQSAINLGVALS